MELPKITQTSNEPYRPTDDFLAAFPIIFSPSPPAAIKQHPPTPTIAECAHTANQMCNFSSQKTVWAELQSRPTGDGDSDNDNDDDSGGISTYRLRQVHVAFGGRIRASWQTVLTATRDHQSSWGKNLFGGGGIRRPCGYSWAIVRTRGVVSDGGIIDQNSNFHSVLLSSRVVLQGAVSQHGREEGRGPGAVRAAAVTGGTIRPVEGKNNGSSSNDAATRSPPLGGLFSAVSPWDWQRLDAETTGWLPGDLLGLWIRLDDFRHFPRLTLTKGASASAGAADGGTDQTGSFDRARIGYSSEKKIAGVGDGGSLRRKRIPATHVWEEGGRGSGRGSLLAFRPKVRNFELRTIDDARTEEIARSVRSCRRYSPLRRYSVPKGGNAGVGRMSEGERGHCPASSSPPPPLPSSSSTSATAPTAVRLDFAAVSPMNMAAAGGSWAR